MRISVSPSACSSASSSITEAAISESRVPGSSAQTSLERACDRDALLLAAGGSGRSAVEPVPEADAGERLTRPRLGLGDAGEEERQLDILVAVRPGSG